ncbi:Conserved_hypothetical protein [Hexamita inflata]|uniref:Transmembrane protein n=1 Tax=Hexamita inflata TaxID=28002 RepID=A0AA86UQG1_9EUKA|nr:Conserved hypothetical protein [Hexamita inflata]
MYYVFVQILLVCFDNITLSSSLMNNAYNLTISPSPECSQFNNQPIIATLRFQNIQLPLQQVQSSLIFQSSQYLSFLFTFDKQTYSELIRNVTADFTLTVSGQTFVKTIPVITHTNFNGNNCWKDVEFSADNDQAFNISVTPLQCQISSKVSVYLEYFNISWIKVPIVSTITSDTQFKGFKNNNYDQANIYYFNTSSTTDSKNAQTIVNFIKYFKSNIYISLRLKIEEKDPSIKIRNTMIVQINKYDNYLSKQCILEQPRITIQSWYAYASIDSSNIVDCFQSDTRSKTFNAILYVYDQNNVKMSVLEYQTDMQLMRQRLGIPFYHIEQKKQINQNIDYNYVLMFQSLDYTGQMINSMYYEGIAITSCYKDMVVEFYKKQVCLKMLLFDNDVCRQQLTTTGMVGLFTGKLDPNISDPSQRETYFWYNINFKVPESWFTSYNRYCFDDNEDTGQYQGTRVSGSLENRLSRLAKGIQNIDLTTNFVINTNLEQFYCSKFSNVLWKSKIIHISIIFGGMFFIVLIIACCVLKHYKYNQQEVINCKQDNTSKEFEPISQISNSEQSELSEPSQIYQDNTNNVNEKID